MVISATEIFNRESKIRRAEYKNPLRDTIIKWLYSIGYSAKKIERKLIGTAFEISDAGVVQVLKRNKVYKGKRNSEDIVTGEEAARIREYLGKFGISTDDI